MSYAQTKQMDKRNVTFRALRKLKILNHVNLSKKIAYGHAQVTVPVVNGLGYPNLFLEPNWLYLLINHFFTKDGDTFIDVGANIGQTLIAVKSADKQIQYVGFEPSASCSYYLKLLVRRNKFADAHVYNFALSDRLKESFLETNGEADPTGSLVQQQRPGFFHQRESIFSLSYDSLGLTAKVNCIKIDVEGGELEALQGMQNLIADNRPYVVCEVLDSFSDDVLEFTQDRANQVGAILKKLDYCVIQIVQNEATDKILGFKELDSIPIKQWTRQSLPLNDYVFFPSEKRDFVKQILNNISGQ